jgi:hypothetical protein
MPGEPQRFKACLQQREKPPSAPQLALDGLQTPSPAALPPRRYCKPCASPFWDIGPDSGRCLSCGREIRDLEVRKWHAIARDERRRIGAKWGAVP